MHKRKYMRSARGPSRWDSQHEHQGSEGTLRGQRNAHATGHRAPGAACWSNGPSPLAPSAARLGSPPSSTRRPSADRTHAGAAGAAAASGRSAAAARAPRRRAYGAVTCSRTWQVPARARQGPQRARQRLQQRAGRIGRVRQIRAAWLIPAAADWRGEFHIGEFALWPRFFDA